MKTLIARFLPALLAVAMALSAAACDITMPEASIKPTPTQHPRPTVTPSPAPTPTPVPNPGLLQFGEVYFMNGDSKQMGIVFFEGGTTENSNGVEARYEVDSSVVSIFVDDEWDSDLLIVDEFILEEVETGIRFIRENGAGFGGVTDIPDGSRDIFFEAYYYLDGEADGASLYFYDFGEVVLDVADEPELGKYTIYAGWIRVTIGGEERMVLRIINAAELVDDDTSEAYALKGAIGAELVLNERYYQFGEAGEVSMSFREDGEVVYEYGGEVISSGAYTVEDGSISVDLDGAETELSIVNSYVLFLLDQELQFVRIPG